MSDILIEWLNRKKIYLNFFLVVFNKFNVKFYYFWGADVDSHIYYYFFIYCYHSPCYDTLTSNHDNVKIPKIIWKWSRFYQANLSMVVHHYLIFPSKYSSYFTLSEFFGSMVYHKMDYFISIQFVCMFLLFSSLYPDRSLIRSRDYDWIKSHLFKILILVFHLIRFQ